MARSEAFLRICEREGVTIEHIDPIVSMSDDHSEEAVFLTPEEGTRKKGEAGDQGASPVLRRSNRKRKSVTLDMTKGSSSKKKKNSSPKNKVSSPEKSMPKLPRTPQGGSDHTKEQEEPERNANDFAAMLLAMENRLASKLDATNKAVQKAVTMSKLTSDALDALEDKVEASDAVVKETLARLEAQEERVLARVEKQVQGMVRNQLKEDGFDTQ